MKLSNTIFGFSIVAIVLSVVAGIGFGAVKIRDFILGILWPNLNWLTIGKYTVGTLFAIFCCVALIVIFDNIGDLAINKLSKSKNKENGKERKKQYN